VDKLPLGGGLRQQQHRALIADGTVVRESGVAALPVGRLAGTPRRGDPPPLGARLLRLLLLLVGLEPHTGWTAPGGARACAAARRAPGRVAVKRPAIHAPECPLAGGPATGASLAAPLDPALAPVARLVHATATPAAPGAA